MVDLKTYLGLTTPNQSCLDVTKLTLSWFWGDNWDKKFQTSTIPTYSTTELYDSKQSLFKLP